MFLTRRLAMAVAVVMLTGAGLTACGGDDRWCEHDATDQQVSDSYCEQGQPGYEWEEGDKKKKKRKKPRTRKTK